MLKRTSMVLLSMLAVAVIMLFAATAVMAACGKDTTNLFLRNSDGSYTQTAYTITFKGVNLDTSTQKYKWQYDISSSGSNSEYDILVPACNNGCQIPLTYSGVTSVVVNNPGQGDKNSGFGIGDFQSRVIQLPSNIASSNSIWFYTDMSSPPVATSLQVKAGKNLLFAEDINGPACPQLPAYVPVTTHTEQNLGPYKMCFDMDQTTGCPINVTDCAGNTIDPVLLQDIGVPPGHLKWVGGESDPRCQSVTWYTESTGCYTKCYPSGYCYKQPPFCL